MNIGLIDVDGHGYPNFALMRLSAYEKARGNNVEMAQGGIFSKHYDLIYAAKIFTFSPDFNDTAYSADKYIRGGSGYDIKSRLPAEVEKSLLMDYSLYDYKFSMQFFSRGCVRRCPFCLVHDKEGYITPVDPVDLNPNGEWIEVLDNNFFANPEWRSAMDYLAEKKQYVRFHGIDIRTITEENIVSLKRIKIKDRINIAWDFPNIDITDQINLFKKHFKPYRLHCYILVGFNSTIEEDLHRIYTLKSLGVDPFVMPYRDFNNMTEPSQYHKDLARWANNKFVFKSTRFEDYKPRKGVYGRDYLKK